MVRRREVKADLCGFEGADEIARACERAGGSKRIQALLGFR